MPGAVTNQISQIIQLKQSLRRSNGKRVCATRPFFPGGASASSTAQNMWAGTSQVQHWFPVACTDVELIVGNYIYNGANSIANGGELGYGPIICSAAYVPNGTTRQLNISNGRRYVVIPKQSTFRTDHGMGLQVPGAAYSNFRVWTCAAPNLISAVASSGGSLPNGTPQFYRATWVAEGQESGSSQEITVTPSGANLQVTLTWTVDKAQVDWIKIYRGTTASSPGTMVLIAEIPGTRGTTYLDTGTGAIAGSGSCPATAQIPVYPVIPNGGANDNCNYASSGGNGTDQTFDFAAAFTNSGSAFNAHIPMAFIGFPLAPLISVALVGDSIVVGIGSSTGRDSDLKKLLDTNKIAYVHLAEGGTTAQHAVLGASSGSVQTNYLERNWLLNHVDYVIGNWGINDVKNARTLAQIKADLLAIWADYAARGLLVIWSTMTPYATSQDTWTTIAGQAPKAVETIRQQLNQWLRAPVSAGAGNSAMYDAGGALYKVWDRGAKVEANANGTLITISAVDGSITNGVGGRYFVPAATFSGTVTTGGTNTWSDSGASFAGLDNKWWVRWVTGANSGATTQLSTGSGFEKAVLSFTSTQITTNGAPTNPVSVGDQYQIVQIGSAEGLHPADANYTLMGAANNLADLVAI